MSDRSKLQVRFLCISVAAEGVFAICAAVTIILTVLLLAMLNRPSLMIEQPLDLLGLKLASRVSD